MKAGLDEDFDRNESLLKAADQLLQFHSGPGTSKRLTPKGAGRRLDEYGDSLAAPLW